MLSLESLAHTGKEWGGWRCRSPAHNAEPNMAVVTAPCREAARAMGLEPNISAVPTPASTLPPPCRETQKATLLSLCRKQVLYVTTLASPLFKILFICFY